MEFAIRRVLLLHGLIMLVGGLPLLYLGDEIGTLNDYSYSNDPGKARDSRWVHRPRADEARYQQRNAPETVPGRVFGGLQKLVGLRKTQTVFSGGKLELVPTENEHVLGFVRAQAGKRVTILVNFSEELQVLPAELLDRLQLSLVERWHGESQFTPAGSLELAPYDLLVLA